MRNVHLFLGLAFVVMALIFALSSMVIIYRPWLNQEAQQTERTVQVPAEAASSPRALARQLMETQGLRGMVAGIEEDSGSIRFRIARPGTAVQVAYDRATGQARLNIRRWGVLETLVQLHVNHGFHHDFFPSDAWAVMSLLASVGLLLLGASGIYLWFAHHKERRIGGVLLGVGLVYALTTMILTRMAQ